MIAQYYTMLCDAPDCAVNIPGYSDRPQLQEDARKAGWSVGVVQSFCPEHSLTAEKARTEVELEDGRVLVATDVWSWAIRFSRGQGQEWVMVKRHHARSRRHRQYTRSTYITCLSIPPTKADKARLKVAALKLWELYDRV